MRLTNNTDQILVESCTTLPSHLTDDGVEKIFTIVLCDFMFGYPAVYQRQDFHLLQEAISNLVSKKLPIKFFLPAFPSKSPNTTDKVFGVTPDFGEFQAIKNILRTLRKIEAIYDHGVEFTLFSDYHTFDQYVGVSEEDYHEYHEGLKKIIYDVGGDDIIKLTSFACCDEFHGVPPSNLSKNLNDRFGENQFMADFDNKLKTDDAFLTEYLRLRKFMEVDQAHRLPGKPKSKASQQFLKELVKGMMAQGRALDQFLRLHTEKKNAIRLSIHNHPPALGKFPLDLFKSNCPGQEILSTPWHNVICFDARHGKFKVGSRKTFAKEKCKDWCLLKVKNRGQDWLYIMVNKAEKLMSSDLEEILEVEMIKGGCGMVIESQMPGLGLDCIDKSSITELVKEFGVVVMRGFNKFNSEKEFLDLYSRRSSNGIVKFDFGYIHKVKVDNNLVGYVGSNQAMPIHFDLILPPPYMGVDQTKHRYQDFIPREFALYCKHCDLEEDEGQTTFVDCQGALFAMTGKSLENYKGITLRYEAKMLDDCEAYFGGNRNYKEYPLIMKCPWTGNNVLRWHEIWDKDLHPASSQVVGYKVRSQGKYQPSARELEAEIKKVALDERFFFGHSYQEGDLVYVNNYMMVHGRSKFNSKLDSKRELWRLQALPPTDNLPEYFRKNNEEDAANHRNPCTQDDNVE